jgi:hypothetical protein
MAFHRLLYRSEVSIPGSDADVQEAVTGIVWASKEANARAGLTGALVHAHGSFIQVLEGPIASVEATFERICCDLRHRRLELLELVPAGERAFGAWSMIQVTPDLRLQQALAELEDHAAPADAVSLQAIIGYMRVMMAST